MEDATRKAVKPKPRDAPLVEDATSFVPGKRFPHFYLQKVGSWPPDVLEELGTESGQESNQPLSSIDIPALASVGTNFVLFCSAPRASSWHACLADTDVWTVELVSREDDADDGARTGTIGGRRESRRSKVLRAVPSGSLWRTLMDQDEDLASSSGRTATFSGAARRACGQERSMNEFVSFVSSHFEMRLIKAANW